MSNNRTRVPALIVAGLVGGSVLLAQQSTGTLKGRVTEKGTGAPKVGVTITAENQGTGFVRIVTSGSDGSFRLPILPLGNYKLNFKSADSTAAIIRTCSLGQETDCSVAMAAAAQATVVVVATSDTVGEINTTSAEVGVNVTSERLESLPVLSRNVVQAAVLAPGVQIISGTQIDPTKKGSSYMAQGDGQGRGTNFNIDGGDNNSTDVGGYVSAIPMDAIGEFQVVTNQYKAEFGRSNAGFLNVVSKAGSNSFAGVITGQYTDQGLRARKTDEGTKKDNSSQIFGATVSGPILKDKIFYMVSAEKRDEKEASATFSPRAIAKWPETAKVQTELKAKTLYSRLDWNATSWLNVTGTYSYDKVETPRQSLGRIEAYNGIYNTAGLTTGTNETNRGGLKFVINLADNMVWESNFVYFDYKNNMRPEADPLGMDSYFCSIQRSTPRNQISPVDLGGVGFFPNTYQNTGIRRFQWRNDLTVMMGSHNFKTGFDYQNYTMAESINFSPFTGVNRFVVGDVPFGDELYGGSQAGWADQHVLRTVLTAKGVTPGVDVKQLGFYAQDDWTLNQNWTMYVGFRADRDNTLDFMQGAAIREMYRQIYETSPAFIRGATPPKDKTYISPRVQIVYKPKGDDSQVYKLGAGRFVANVVDNITGFSRGLLVPVNGFPQTVIGNRAAQTFTGATTGANFLVDSFAQGATWSNLNINGNFITLPADLTPYNYAHNVNGLQDYFKTTVHSWLRPASFGTGGKNLMASDFEYPTTDTLTLSGAWKFAQRHALELTLLWSRTEHNGTNYASDGLDQVVGYDTDGEAITVSTPQTWSIGPERDPDGNPIDMGDTLFLSNQRSEITQISAKYVYTAPRLSVLFSMTYKNARSSSGGAGGAFDAQAGADIFGGGATLPWVTNHMRPSHGAENLQGSFAVNYQAPWGTSFGLLGSWHGPKKFDTFLGYNPDLGPVGYITNANPDVWMGMGEGQWNMDLSLRVGHAFKYKKLGIEPYITIQNVLNNYDYGSNYNRKMFERDGTYDPTYAQRGVAFQANAPRTAAAGFRMTF